MASAITSGTIVEATIEATRVQIKTIVDSYADCNKKVHSISATVKESWVGEGRSEFEAQYEMLLSKIDDFGDTLEDIYDALVEAQAEYQTTDDDIRQDIAMSTQS